MLQNVEQYSCSKYRNEQNGTRLICFKKSARNTYILHLSRKNMQTLQTGERNFKGFYQKKSNLISSQKHLEKKPWSRKTASQKILQFCEIENEIHKIFVTFVSFWREKNNPDFSRYPNIVGYIQVITLLIELIQLKVFQNSSTYLFSSRFLIDLGSVTSNFRHQQ